MNKAENFKKIFEAQDRHPVDGSYDLSPISLLISLNEIVERDDLGNSENSCPSYDPTEVWTFQDGSKLRVGNPSQAAFAGFVEIL